MHRYTMLCSHNTVESLLAPSKSTRDVRHCSSLRILLRPRFGILYKFLLVLLIFPGYASLHRIIGLRLQQQRLSKAEYRIDLR